VFFMEGGRGDPGGPATPTGTPPSRGAGASPVVGPLAKLPVGGGGGHPGWVERIGWLAQGGGARGGARHGGGGGGRTGVEVGRGGVGGGAPRGRGD